MLTSLLSFLGGNVFRMLWGEVSHWITEKQNHKFELERMAAQEGLDASAHVRNLESLRLQNDLGVKVIQVQAEADINKIESDAWGYLSKSTSNIVGIAFIDAWNQSIRPALATWSVFMMTASEFKFFALSELVMSICSAVLGLYLADRSLMKRGK